MVQNEIDLCLLPLKYKIKQYVDVQTRFLEIYPFLTNSKHKNTLLKLANKIKEKKLTRPDTKKVHIVVYMFELRQLKKNKKSLLTEDYCDEVLYKREWIFLQNAFADPVYTFQEQFFKFFIHQKLRNIFGEQLAALIREVLRDGFITNIEKEYICERAQELGYDTENVLEKLDKYKSQNLAMYETLYEICKDGIITDTEKRYLWQKAEEYKINSSQLLPMIEDIIELINTIQTLFKENEFYEAVQYVFLSQFFIKAGFEFSNNWMEKLYISICERSGQWIQEHEKSAFLKSVSKYLTNRFYGVSPTLNVNSNNDLYALLGIKPRKGSQLFDSIRKVNANLIADSKLIEVLKKNDSERNYKTVVGKGQKVFELGGEIYEFVTIKDSNRPLFGFDVIGNKTIITINRDHYFHKDTEYFQLLVITFVNNLKKNYASEDLIEEVQHLLNPPATLRINYQKTTYDIN